MKGGVSAIHSLHCSFEWHLHSVPLHLIWSLTVRSLPLAASRNSQLSCLPHIWLAYNYAHSILHCIKMMSSWLPANLFKSAPARRSRGEEEGGGARGGRPPERGGGRGEQAEATRRGAGSPAPRPSSCPTSPSPSPSPGQGGPGMPGCDAGAPRRLRQRWRVVPPSRGVNCLLSCVTLPAPRLFQRWHLWKIFTPCRLYGLFAFK